MNAMIPHDQLSPDDDFDPFAAGAIERIVPTTEAQREIWLADRMAPEASLAYNESALIELNGPLQLDALQAALQDLLERHEALRSTFGADGTDLSINGGLFLEALVLDLSALAPAERDAQAQQICERAVLTPFDLEQGPLIRADLIRLAADRHTLVLTAHHLVCDGYSLGVLVRDLSALYRQRLGIPGEALPAPESYGDYALNEAQQVSGERLEADKRYWLDVFKGELPILDLPLDRSRPALRGFEARIETLRVPADLVDGIRKVGARNGTSLFATLLAAFGGLLSRLSGSQDLVVGVPAAGQVVHGRERLVGHCVQLLPLRLAVTPDTALPDLLNTARGALLDAFDHASLTYGSLLQQLPIARDPSRPPLVAVMFNVDAAIRSEEVSVGDLQISVRNNPRHFDNFELFLNCSQHGGEIVLELQYSTTLFERATAQRWLQLYRESLARAVADATQPVATLMSPTDSELALLSGFNPGPTALDTSLRIEHLFAQQVQAHPQAIAVVAGDRQWTYAELDAQANGVAQALLSRGVEAGSLVGLHCSRDLPMLAAQLGILKAGAGYVPLDPAFPAERLNFMAQDANLGCVVVDAATGSGWPATALLPDVVLQIDALAPQTDAPASRGASADVAYMIYTSGSTGKPKGVRVPHHAVVNFLQSMAREPGLKPEDRLLAVTTLSFDIAVLELLLPLTVGASVVLASRDQAADGVALCELLHSSGATVLQATPSTWRILLDAGWQGSRGFKGLIGGEALPRDLVPSLLKRCSELWNMYGPTETTVWSSLHKVSAGGGAVPIGKPIANTQFHVLDDKFRRLPLGAIGELCIGGAGVTLGYHERPDLTADRFVPDPYADQPGAFLYRTGDRGRWRADGLLECHGRLDHQVKLRGYRIELGEIETRLSQHPAVAHALVMVREDQPGDQRLTAYVVVRGQAPGDDVWREFLGQSLPAYMVPQHFMVLAALPLLPNGKTDRKALPQPQSLAVALSPQELPRDEIETAVAEAMAQVLSISSVGLHQNFFELGGHSLLATQLLTRLAVTTGKRVGLRALFESPTVARLATHYRASVDDVLRIPRRADRTTAALSPVQERMWFIENLHAGTNVHNVPSGHRLHGPLKLAAFRRAIECLIERQEALRTVVVEQGDGVVQLILPGLPAGTDWLPFADLSDLSPEQQSARLDEELPALIRQPIDVKAAPLVRMRLYRLGPQEHLFFFMTHHMFWDGFSFDVLYREMAALYPACADDSGATPLPPALPLSYGDYAQWQADRMRGEESHRQTRYWLEQLTPLPPVLELPLDKPRPAELDNAGATHALRMSMALTESLNAYAKRLGTTVYSVVLAAYAVTLHQWSRHDEFVVGTPVWGRDFPDLDRLLGAFINVLPLRMRLDAAEPFEQFVERVRKQTTDGFSYPDVPFEQVVEALKLPRDGSRTPVYQAMFSYQDVRERLTRWGDLTHERAPQRTHASAQDVGFWVVLTAQGLEVQVRYNTHLFEAATAAALGATFEHVLSQVVHQSGTPIGALNTLMPADQRLLQDWNATQTALAGGERIFDAFVRQAQAQPDAPALICPGETTLSYAQLDAASNRLAHALRGRGVGRGDRVGLYLERSASMVVAVWAVLKSGAAYVPLDPSYPSERIAYVVRDSAVALVLSEAALPPLADVPADRTLLLDAHEGQIQSHPDTPLTLDEQRDAREDDPAYVIYTSGSTGKPKGVVVHHRAVANFLQSMARKPGMGAADRVLAVTTLSFDIAVLELLLPMTVGASIVLAVRDDVLDGHALCGLIESQAVTLLQATPSTWRMLLDAGWSGAAGFKGLIGGESLPVDLVAPLLSRCAELWNMYGPTETTVWSTCIRVLSASDRITIGTPIANTTVHVLDANGHEMPIGVAGELCIGGEGVTQGYFGRADLTAERFIPDPYGTVPNARLYRTGDRGRWLRDGRIEHLGRLDFQVKVRGHRIELGEIEATLASHPDVARAVVIVREDQPGDQRLVAYLVGRGLLPQSLVLRDHLRLTLPAYMVPQHFVALDQIPLLPNGKIDRSALPVPSAPSAAVAAVAPEPLATDTQRQLAAIWEELLGVSNPHREDNFFDLGGSSMVAMQAIARMHQATGKRVKVRSYIFETLEQIAAAYDAAEFEPVVAAQPERKVGLLGRLFSGGKR